VSLPQKGAIGHCVDQTPVLDSTHCFKTAILFPGSNDVDPINKEVLHGFGEKFKIL
jgi:hypothetical protein